LALVYLGSIPFFVGLYKTFKVLGYVGKNKVFTTTAVKALRTIRYCAFIVIGFVVVEEIFIILTPGNDDATGGFFIGALIFVGSGIVASLARMFEKILKKAVEMKSENDLTV